MKNIKLKLIASLLLGTICSVTHAESVPLFKQYKYGQSINEFQLNKGYEDCSNDIGQTARCIENEKFFGFDFTVALLFSNDTLTRVSLISDFDVNKYKTLIGSLPKNGFNLVLLQGKSERLDVLETLDKKESFDDFKAKLSAFESVQLTNGQITYSYLESSAKELKQFKNAVTAMEKSSENTRELDFMIIDDESPKIILSFMLPRAFINEIKENSKVSNEKF